MFDVGFSEMLVIGIVALVVIGPEKLPRVARTVGALLGRMQRYVNDVKADINREMELDELKKLQTTVQDAASSIQSSVNETVSGFQSQADELNKIASGDVAGLTETKPAEAGSAATSTFAEVGTPALTAADTVVPSTPSTPTMTPSTVSASAEMSSSASGESGSHQTSQASLFAEAAPTKPLGPAPATKPVATA